MYIYTCIVYLRNKSWKPECVLSFNMGTSFDFKRDFFFRF